MGLVISQTQRASWQRKYQMLHSHSRMWKNKQMLIRSVSHGVRPHLTVDLHYLTMLFYLIVVKEQHLQL